jgi:membrane protease YdiL (CAAX protease family)/Pyruvate/2-oxoacid:ferredoxin oxidoreductase delta subunit
MTTVRPKLRLDPTLCDECGRCVRSCVGKAIAVGPTFIYVDWVECDGCGACAEVCDRGAIVELTDAAAPNANGTLADRARDRSTTGAVTSGPPTSSPPSAGRAGHAAEPGPSPWSLVDAATILGVMLIVLALETLLLRLPVISHLPVHARFPIRAAVVLAYMAGVGGFTIWLGRRHGLRLRDAFALRRFDYLPETGWVLLSMFGVWGATLVYGLALDLAGHPVPKGARPDITQYFGSDPLGLVLTMFIAVIAGPIVEEMVFRGVLLRALRTRMGAGWAIATSAAIFAAMHANAWLFAPLLLVGVVLGRLLVTRDSLWPPIIFHSLYNLTSVLVAYSLVPYLGRFGG